MWAKIKWDTVTHRSLFFHSFSFYSKYCWYLHRPNCCSCTKAILLYSMYSLVYIHLKVCQPLLCTSFLLLMFLKHNVHFQVFYHIWGQLSSLSLGTQSLKGLTWQTLTTSRCVYLLLQAFDPVSVSSLPGAQRSLDVPEAGPQSLRLPLGLITLLHQTLTQTVRLLHLSQLSLLKSHTHAHTHRGKRMERLWFSLLFHTAFQKEKAKVNKTVIMLEALWWPGQKPYSCFLEVNEPEAFLEQ